MHVAKQGRASVPVAEPLDMTAGVDPVSGQGALSLSTQGAEDIPSEGRCGHEFGVKNYSALKWTGSGVGIWGRMF